MSIADNDGNVKEKPADQAIAEPEKVWYIERAEVVPRCPGFVGTGARPAASKAYGGSDKPPLRRKAR
jgi:hypothetical protein